jgi:hypothetical protein
MAVTAPRSYRCYLLSSDNRIKDVVQFAAPNDADAIAMAERHLEERQQRMENRRFYAGVEIWEGARVIYFRLPPSKP